MRGEARCLNRWAVVRGLLLAMCLGVAPIVSGDAEERPHEPDYIVAGKQLTAEDAQELESRLRHDPRDEDARMQLVVYYHEADYRDSVAAKRHGAHVLWFVRHAPRSRMFERHYTRIMPHRNPDAYVAAKQAWLEHIERMPNDVSVLATAADSFDTFVDGDLAISLMKRAHEADPSNPSWPYRIGSLMWNRSGDAGEAEAALQYFERAHELCPDGDNSFYLASLMEAAFAAGQFDTVRAHAARVLPVQDIETMGHLHHQANMLLGRIALAEGDVKNAGERLLEAAKTSGSPVLGSFGPSMLLARDLLERGEDEVVLKYLEACRRFWPHPKIPGWVATIQAGHIPDFGMNLR